MLIESYDGEYEYSILFYGDNLNLCHYTSVYYQNVLKKYFLDLYTKGYLTTEKGTENGNEYFEYTFHYPLTIKELKYAIKIFKCISKSEKFIKKIRN